MLTYVHAFALGLIEGITEFLPISSTGHLILASHIMGLEPSDFLKSFEIFIQLGAILAVVVLYWKKLFLNIQIFKRIVVASIPTAIIGVLLYKTVKTYLLGNASVVVSALIIGGALFIIFERMHRGRTREVTEGDAALESITYPQALFIGIFQAFAIIPGVSRAGATIIGGLLLGISRTAIVEFSFMLAIPTMAGAVALDLLGGAPLDAGQVGLVGVGFVVAFVSALLAVKYLLRFIKSHTFIPFGVYRIVIALLFLVFIL